MDSITLQIPFSERNSLRGNFLIETPDIIFESHEPISVK
jgi:hypothetical protein